MALNGLDQVDMVLEGLRIVGLYADVVHVVHIENAGSIP